ncbi:hypothetical protein FA95DRAFT_671202 [Auriscalpium vulgare]|uniref:Uncharacterized protein n=1 Tax=Auriscalpium vulgare TaxID=40419 RepID=A0ACB8RCU7_9AGAM|nr:hypothetical protein FA95DRAFT_671202 [Auriscalpium vulgare]
MSSPAVVRRLMRELAELRTNPPEGIRVETNEDNMLDVTGIIEGPGGTPYAGGYFRIKFKFTDEFPAAPPKCWFATKIFHPNVSGAGEICVNTLKKDWQSSYGIAHILVTVKCLLIYPNPDSALDEEAGKLLQEDYALYCQRARLITSVHATPRVPPPQFASAGTSTGSARVSPAPTLPAATVATAAPHHARSSATPEPRAAPVRPLSKSAHAPPPAQPLQPSASNTLSVSSSLSSLASAQDKPKERPASLAPLGTADSNVAPKAVKRGAAAGIVGGEKRKKALKRL